jgi:predicted esterase
MKDRICVGVLCGLIPALLGAQEPKPRPTPRIPGQIPPVAQPAPAPQPAPAAQPAPAGPAGVDATQLPSFAGCSPSVYAWWQHTVGTGQYGRISCAKDPTRPAILLFHGNHEDGRTWTAPSHTDYAYDYARHPGTKRIGETHTLPNSGVYKIGASEWLYGSDRAGWDKANNWFDYLVRQGFTVATWSQDMFTVAKAMESTGEAFDSFLVHTAARSPGAPPPVALVGHSRGGLLIRKILKEKGSMGRVKWAVTLHSPHAGSELGRAPGLVVAEVLDLMDCCAPAPVKQKLRDLVVEIMRPATTHCSFLWCWNDEDRELQPNSPMLQKIADGEKKLEDVTYYTFGGTNPRVYRLYTWLFDAQSGVPQYSKDRGQYFVWRVKPVEVASVSPILDKIRDFTPEVVPGKGDALVSDARSRLPWSIHTTTQLNHAELLWDKPLMAKVAGLIGGPMAAGPGRGEGRTARTEVLTPRRTQ